MKAKKLAKAFLFPHIAIMILLLPLATVLLVGSMTATAQKWMLGATGAAISLLIVATAIYMIVVGTKKLKELKTEVNNG